jgi:Clr5 domain
MDLFEEYASPAALPDALTSFEPDPIPQQQLAQDVFIFHDVPVEPRVRESIKQKWETLKPLIKQIYIDENKPFPYLARILREDHQFEATYVPISFNNSRSP